MSGRTALLAVAAAAFLIVPAVPAQQAPGDFRLLFTGDVMMSRLVRLEIDQRKTSPWTGFSDLFSSASLVGGNFEGALGDPAKCPAVNKLCFAAPDSSAELMRQVGFRLVTAENNHSGDLGQAAGAAALPDPRHIGFSFGRARDRRFRWSCRFGRVLRGEG